MRLDYRNYNLGDVVLLDGVEMSPSEVNYADDDLGEVGIAELQGGDKWPDRAKVIAMHIKRGKVEIQRAAASAERD